jgi:membrane-associated protein
MMLEQLQRLGEHVGAWLYLIAGFLAFAEAAIMVGLVFPGETALLVAGFAAHQGWIGLGPMLSVAIVAAVAGDSVGYQLGRHYGPALRATRLGRHVGPARWASADGFLHRHGGKAILLGRFTALLRALTPGLAGMARMPYLRTFLPWNIAGAILWGAGVVLLGYSFSAALPTLHRYLTYSPVLLIATVIAAVLAVRLLHRRRPRRTVSSAPDPDSQLSITVI